MASGPRKTGSGYQVTYNTKILPAKLGLESKG